MNQKQARGVMEKVFKLRGAKARKGQLRLQAGDLFWYVTIRATAPAPSAPLILETGCWVPEIVPEPEGGAVDCPLLLDLPVGDDPARAAHEAVDLMEATSTLDALGALLAAHPEALVDRILRERLLG